MRSRLGEPGVDWVEAEEGEVDLAGNHALYKAILLWERYTVPTGII